ncbi:MAG TPA: metallophosphoesterase [Bacillota bacterium]|nr:metallophosphoesterase [Bacillota bacterium]HPL52551.1 metallophosphoesterase [Bacillota bacterium]
MKIGVISDTHIRSSAKLLPNIIFKAFDGVEMILHAGDILIDEVIIELETIAPVYAVAGNNDDYDMLYKYGTKRIIEVNGKRIGLTHGSSRGRTYLNAYDIFSRNNVDCVVYGHSHKPHNEMINGVLFFNPGSPTSKRFEPRYSLGLLYVDKDIRGEILYFD